ncbi:MAG: OmpA family protein [Nitrospirae bacterium]|uniref:flagellar motor protein MotB n=1 Tax=Candidatus Magnetobacterium casense TaxID=1455061 RepID=UPI0009DD1794|nr:flagellar motor protein MotB [Candidatus Magnetobacterium casensis]MBF0336254.1 OmpA family protein [Nitrospirota bacterium]
MKGQSIIIKKVKKAGHGGGHGGSWKVAYADFVTAMMAFFLLMWLLSMVSPDKRLKLASYFNQLSIYDSMGYSFLGKGADVLDTQIPKSEIMPSDRQSGSFFSIKDELTKKLKEQVEKKMADVKDQVMVDVVENGVRIQLIDKEGGKPMFALGKADLTPDAKAIIKIVTENIKDIQDAKVSVEGHTDALNYATTKYTNWELSTDRASSARKELENNGLNPDRLSKVAGFAATDLLIKTSPTDPRNRRISILVFSETKSDNLKKINVTNEIPQLKSQ